jgi:hypothetical protein
MLCNLVLSSSVTFVTYTGGKSFFSFHCKSKKAQLVSDIQAGRQTLNCAFLRLRMFASLSSLLPSFPYQIVIKIYLTKWNSDDLIQFVFLQMEDKRCVSPFLPFWFELGRRFFVFVARSNGKKGIGANWIGSDTRIGAIESFMCPLRSVHDTLYLTRGSNRRRAVFWVINEPFSGKRKK